MPYSGEGSAGQRSLEVRLVVRYFPLRLVLGVWHLPEPDISSEAVAATIPNIERSNH